MQRIQARPGSEEAPVLVAPGTALLHAREMEKRLRDVVARRSLTARERFPCVGAVRNVVAEPEVVRSDRIEHPPRAPLDLRRGHGRTTRLQCTNADLGSSRAHIPSTYGGRCSAG